MRNSGNYIYGYAHSFFGKDFFIQAAILVLFIKINTFIIKCMIYRHIFLNNKQINASISQIKL